MKANFKKWDDARKILTGKMDKMSMQTSNGCMRDLDLIESDFISQYNSYVELYNYQVNMHDVSGLISPIEARMIDVIKRINAAPTYCY
mgnify:CR=1 FL=1